MKGSDPRVYFWPYDIFGYLLPGVIVVAPLIEFQKDLRDVFVKRYQVDSIVDNVVLLGAIYVVGHLVSAASSFWLERVALRVSFGYPLSQFFSKPGSGSVVRRCVVYLATPERWFGLAAWHAEKGMRGWLYAVAARIGRWLRRQLDLLPGYCHPYDPIIVDVIQKRFDLRFGTSFPDWEVDRRVHEAYWSIWAFVAENMPMAYRSAMHFLELYGFCRNSAFAFGLAAFYPLCPGWTTAKLLDDGVASSGAEVVTPLVWSCGCAVAALLMYVNFAKLIRRQNDFLLRSFMFDPAPQ